MNGGLSQFMRVMASVDPALVRMANQTPTPVAHYPALGAARQADPTPETPSLSRQPAAREAN